MIEHHLAYIDSDLFSMWNDGLPWEEALERYENSKRYFSSSLPLYIKDGLIYTPMSFLDWDRCPFDEAKIIVFNQDELNNLLGEQQATDPFALFMSQGTLTLGYEYPCGAFTHNDEVVILSP